MRFLRFNRARARARARNGRLSFRNPYEIDGRRVMVVNRSSRIRSSTTSAAHAVALQFNRRTITLHLSRNATTGASLGCNPRSPRQTSLQSRNATACESRRCSVGAIGRRASMGKRKTQLRRLGRGRKNAYQTGKVECPLYAIRPP